MVRITPTVEIPEHELSFTAIRAQGAGGQNVNKVANAVHLRFDAGRSSALSDACKERLLASRDQRISRDGIVVIKAQQFRSLERNKEAALARLAELVRRALVEPKARRRTTPPPGVRRKRLEAKARRGAVKRERRVEPE